MTKTEPIVYVVDDDPLVLRAIARLLEGAAFRVVACSSARQFLEQHDPGIPCCLVLDLAMPDIDGLQLQQSLESAGESLPIIFLTGRADVSATVRAMKQGAADFLTKPVDRNKLVPAVCAALANDLIVRQARREVAEIKRRLKLLTPREYQVFEHVISGDLNKQTAADLGAAEKTIKIHRARVMEKMNVRSVAELVRLAEHAGIAALATQA
jgi:FixJ family two-component response regulator